MNILKGSGGGRDSARVLRASTFAVEAVERRLLLSAGVAYLHSSSILPGVSTGQGIVVGDQAIICGDVLDDNPAFQGGPLNIYDGDTHRWATIDDPDELASRGVAAVGGSLVLAGGISGFYYGNGAQTSDVVNIYHPSDGSWSTSTLPQARSGLVAVTVNNEAVFAGGPDDSDIADIYDPATGQWTTSIMPQAETDLVAVGPCVGQAVFYSPNDGKVFTFDASSGQWSSGSPSTVRSQVATAIVGNFVLFAGGDVGTTPSNTVDIYNAAENQWSTTSLPYAASSICAVADGSQAYFAGGVTGQAAVEDTLLADDFCSFDPATGVWSPLQHLPSPRGSAQAAVVGNDILFGGGSGGSVNIYDTADGTWSVAPTSSGGWVALGLPNAAIFDSWAGDVGTYADVYTPAGDPITATLLPTPVLHRDSKGYQFSVAYHDSIGDVDRNTVAGAIKVTEGSDFYTTPASLVWVHTGKHGSTVVATYSFRAQFRNSDNGSYGIELQTGVVSDVEGESAPGNMLGSFQVDIPVMQPPANPVHRRYQLSVGRQFLSATAVNGDALFAGGGYTAYGGGNTSNIVDIYHETSGTWTTAGLSQARSDPIAVASGDDALFIGGGTSLNVPSNVVDIYNTSTGRWTTTFMPQLHTGAAAVGDQVIIAGGGLYTDQAETYNTKTGKWSISELPQRIDRSPGVSLGNKAYFVAENGQALDIYNADTGTWSSVAAPLQADEDCAATSAGEDVLFSDPKGIWVYNTTTGKWQAEHLVTTGPNIMAGTFGNTAFFTGAETINTDGEGQVLNTVYEFSAKTGQWSTARLPLAAVGPGVAVTGDIALFAGDDGAYIEVLHNPNPSASNPNTGSSITWQR